VRASPRWQIASGVRPAISSPLKRIEPAVAASAPEMQLKQVVLPDPLGPIRPRISPAFTSKETAFRAVKPPNCLVSRSTVSTERGEAEARRPPPRDGDLGQRAAQGDPAGRRTGGLGVAMTGGHTWRNWPSTTWYTAAIARSF